MAYADHTVSDPGECGQRGHDVCPYAQRAGVNIKVALRDIEGIQNHEHVRDHCDQQSGKAHDAAN